MGYGCAGANFQPHAKRGMSSVASRIGQISRLLRFDMLGFLIT